MLRQLFKVVQLKQCITKLKSMSTSSLIGKHITQATDLSCQQIESLLWTSLELKALCRSWPLNFFRNEIITLIMDKGYINLMMNAQNATALLGIKLNTIVNKDWETHRFMGDTAKYLSQHSNLILCQANRQLKLQSLVSVSEIPVICLQSCRYHILQCLGDLMTIHEHYGHLSGLNLAFIGPACQLINTYLCIAPKLGMNINYLCSSKPGVHVSPALVPVGQMACAEKKTTLKECEQLSQTIRGAHVISTGCHEMKELTLTNAKLTEADPRWILFHGLPRKGHEIEESLSSSERNMVWTSSLNCTFILAALILRVLKQYEHIGQKPKFANTDDC